MITSGSPAIYLFLPAICTMYVFAVCALVDLHHSPRRSIGTADETFVKRMQRKVGFYLINLVL